MMKLYRLVCQVKICHSLMNCLSLIELGVDSFKIEGRMKSLHYIATVVSTYRKLIDTYCADPDHFNKEGYRKEIEKAANRALCTGFFKEFSKQPISTL